MNLLFGYLKFVKMYYLIIWIFVIVCYFSFSSDLDASSYYVDKYASGSNDGTSWENAWNTFDAIEWSRLKPGDILFISGGKDSVIYNETLNIKISGSDKKLFTIRNGLDPKHNGKVIFDISNIGIKIIKNSYIRITNLNFKNVSHGIYIRGTRTGNVNVIYLDSLNISNYTNQGAIFINGWSSSRLEDTVDSIFIRYCTIRTSYPTLMQTDVIYAQYCSNIFILNNYLTVTSEMRGSHTDVIQFVHNMKNITIANNTINNLTDSDVNNKSNGIMGADLIGKGLFYNNIVYAPFFKVSGNNVFSYGNGTSDDESGSWYIYNNVFIGGGTINLFYIEDKDAHIKNNIFYSIVAGTGQVFIRVPLVDWSRLDHNLYGQNNGVSGKAVINFEGSKTFFEMQELGAELNGIDRQNPLFVSPFSNLHLQTDSPALGRGINLGVLFNKDKNDVIRPKVGNWDIGCYQNN